MMFLSQACLRCAASSLSPLPLKQPNPQARAFRTRGRAIEFHFCRFQDD